MHGRTRRRRIVEEVAARLADLDPVLGDVSGVRITVRLWVDGSPRVVVVEPEIRHELQPPRGVVDAIKANEGRG